MQQGLPRPLHLFAVRASDSHNGNHAGLLHKLGLSDAECEAAVVASNVPEAPPIPPKPASLVGTPVVPSLPLNRRPRHNRRMPVLREAFQETTISPANFVYPIFIHEGEEDTPTGAMPGCYRLRWRHELVQESSTGNEAYNDNGLVPRSIRLLKDKFPDLDMYDNLSQKIEDVMTAKAIPFPLDGEYTSFLNTG
ncbi:Delta-aminolevulinic acid dehydratase 1 [Arachis hypogaea]|uniref:porphobilinogen synthase n=1 Tax=Arachis hypogaea TaxID=3818 RepID=A0A6B9V7M3_ARAHY|nr:Delta-aminolevulinic acid dehydratase 1 [Arachis hypogaea]